MPNRTASGTKCPIEGYGDLPLTFRSSDGMVRLLLCGVVHAPRLGYHLLSLRVAAYNGHQYRATEESIMVKFTTGGKLFFPSAGRLNFLYAYGPNALVDEIANATITPGPMPTNQADPIDINDFYVAHTHPGEGALRKTAKQIGFIFVGKLHDECKGCSLAKGIRMSFLSKTSNRTSKPSEKGEGNDGTEDR